MPNRARCRRENAPTGRRASLSSPREIQLAAACRGRQRPVASCTAVDAFAIGIPSRKPFELVKSSLVAVRTQLTKQADDALCGGLRASGVGLIANLHGSKPHMPAGARRWRTWAAARCSSCSAQRDASILVWGGVSEANSRSWPAKMVLNWAQQLCSPSVVFAHLADSGSHMNLKGRQYLQKGTEL